MSFLIPAIAPIAGAGASYLFNKFGGGGGGGGSGTSSKEVNALLNGQKEASEFALGQAKSTIPGAVSDIDTAGSFLRKLLGGDQAESASVLGPQIGLISSQYGAARRAVSQGLPRGGGRGSIMAQSGLASAGKISDLIAGLKPFALQQLLRVGELKGLLGTELTRAAAGAGESALRSATALRGQDIEQSSKFGENVGGAIANILNKSKSKGGSSGSAAAPPIEDYGTIAEGY